MRYFLFTAFFLFFQMSCKDKKNTEIVFETFQHISQSYNQALLIVTHDPGFASRTHRIIEMEDGRIVK
jgi:lipoprotein-releasing system ATP-binding protein